MCSSSKLADFKETEKNCSSVIFENDLTRIQAAPLLYVNFKVIDLVICNKG